MNKPFGSLDTSTFGFGRSHTHPERLGKRPLDVFVRGLLEQKPELRNNIISTLQLLNKESSKLPVIHITSSGIKNDDETRVTGFVESIKQSGFRARHTNVGVFVERRDVTRRAVARYYIDHPEEFIKSILLLLKRYGHHGSRTNKDALGENRDKGEGIPLMLMIEGDVELEKGSDFDDHFILKEWVSSDKIIGEIDLNAYRPYQSHLGEIVDDFLERLNERYGHTPKPDSKLEDF